MLILYFERWTVFTLNWRKLDLDTYLVIRTGCHVRS